MLGNLRCRRKKALIASLKDVSVSPHCFGAIKVLTVITEPGVVASILAIIGRNRIPLLLLDKNLFRQIEIYGLSHNARQLFRRNNCLVLFE